jgi:hypothetical protein
MESRRRPAVHGSEDAHPEGPASKPVEEFSMQRVLIPAACCAALVVFSGIAQAHGGGRWHRGARVGVWVGAPVVIGAPYYYPPPSAYTYGPPVVRE